MDGIDKVGGGGNLVQLRPASVPAAPAPVAVVPAKAPSASEVANLISLLGDIPPPIDSKKVEAIKSLIASGAYPIDEHAVAAKMLALDFPARGDNADA
jgi:flagellar biosynthesis anti-sigma factor FlgM